jgi:hypothetical protein
MKYDSRLGRTLALGYLGLFALCGLYAIWLLVFHAADSAYCGLPAILITEPWSMMSMSLIDRLGFVGWYEQFSKWPAVYGFFAMMTLLPSALINAALLYLLGRMIEGPFRPKSDPHQ